MEDDFKSLETIFGGKENLFKWMYDERVFHIFGMAGKTHPKVIDHLNIFSNFAEQNGYKTIITSVQRDRSIIATLHWLSKNGCKIKNYLFFDNFKDKVDAKFDVYVDDCPEVLGKAPKESIVIRVPYGYNSMFTDCHILDIANGKFNDIYSILGLNVKEEK